jgi:hypothetical protein
VEDEALRMEERMARRLRRGAAEFAASGPGEEALVAALHRQAANADAARDTVLAFTASVRRFRAAGSTSRPRPLAGTGTGTGDDDDAHQNLASVYLVVVVCFYSILKNVAEMCVFHSHRPRSNPTQTY